MATITLRMSEEDTRLIRQYAEMTGTTVSQFVRQAALDRIEDEYDRSALTRYLEMGSNRDSPERIMRISMSAAYSSKRATAAASSRAGSLANTARSGQERISGRDSWNTAF